MPKPQMRTRDDNDLVSGIMKALLDGHHAWRPDLHYPESSSDLQGAVYGLLVRFDVKRRPIDRPLDLECSSEAGHERCCNPLTWKK